MEVAFSATIVQLKYAVKPCMESSAFFPFNSYYDVICAAKINSGLLFALLLFHVALS